MFHDDRALPRYAGPTQLMFISIYDIMVPRAYNVHNCCTRVYASYNVVHRITPPRHPPRNRGVEMSNEAFES